MFCNLPPYWFILASLGKFFYLLSVDHVNLSKLDKVGEMLQNHPRKSGRISSKSRIHGAIAGIQIYCNQINTILFIPKDKCPDSQRIMTSFPEDNFTFPRGQFHVFRRTISRFSEDNFTFPRGQFCTLRKINYSKKFLPSNNNDDSVVICKMLYFGKSLLWIVWKLCHTYLKCIKHIL